MSKKSRSHKWRGGTISRALVCTVVSAAGYPYDVAPSLFNDWHRAGMLDLSSANQMRARVISGYDVRPNAAGRLAIVNLDDQAGASIKSQWEIQIEPEFLKDPSGRSVTYEQRQAAIDEECRGLKRFRQVVGRGFIGGEIR